MQSKWGMWRRDDLYSMLESISGQIEFVPYANCHISIFCHTTFTSYIAIWGTLWHSWPVFLSWHTAGSLASIGDASWGDMQRVSDRILSGKWPAMFGFKQHVSARLLRKSQLWSPPLSGLPCIINVNNWWARDEKKAGKIPEKTSRVLWNDHNLVQIPTKILIALKKWSLFWARGSGLLGLFHIAFDDIPHLHKNWDTKVMKR